MWMMKTKPDMAVAINIIYRNMDNPNKLDFDRLKRIHQYLANTTMIGMIREVKDDFINLEHNIIYDQLTAHADYYLAGSMIDSKSTSGYILNFGNTGTFVFITRLQKNVSLSTTHEITYIYEYAKTIEWTRGIMGESGLLVKKSTILYQNN